jgi:uncharacterized membrane protein
MMDELEEHMKHHHYLKRRDDRLWLAGLAMQALVAQGSNDVWRIAHQSLAMADALLEAEERSGQAQG